MQLISEEYFSVQRTIHTALELLQCIMSAGLLEDSWSHGCLLEVVEHFWEVIADSWSHGHLSNDLCSADMMEDTCFLEYT